MVAWQRGETPGPWTLSLFPTYRCNLTCRICWKRSFDEPLAASDEVSDDRLLKLVAEAAALDVRQWVIGGGGEMMLRGDLVMRLCAEVRAQGMNGVLQSNGTRFTADHLESLVKLGWTYLDISLDGPNAAINDAIRSEGSFDQILSTIRRLNEIKEKHGATSPVVNLVTVMTRLNWDTVEDMVSAAHDLGCGSVNLVSLILYGDATKRFALEDAQKAALPDRVGRAQQLANRFGITTNFAAYLQSVRGETPAALQLFSAAEDSLSSRTMCFEPWLSLVIMPAGHAGPCCTFWDPGADTIRDRSLREVWLGPYMQELRRRILQGGPPGYCANCLPSQILENRAIQRAELLWQNRKGVPRAARFAKLLVKAGSSVRRDGLKTAIRRGREWWSIREALKRRTKG